MDKDEAEKLKQILKDKSEEYKLRQAQKKKVEELDLSEYPNQQLTPPKPQG